MQALFRALTFNAYIELCIVLGTGFFSVLAMAQDSLEPEQLYRNYSADALPVLSRQGAFPVGVRTLVATNPDQPEMMMPGFLTANRGDRKVTLEIWYPAAQASAEAAVYQNETRTGRPFAVLGTASRDAALAAGNKTYPVVILSHGYTGYRSIMFYLGEHLASHGYIVAGIDHPNSTNADIDHLAGPGAGFLDTLYYRSRDQQFVLDYVSSNLNEDDFPLSLRADPQQAAIIGYSMGGYGAVATIGGCYAFPDILLAGLAGSDATDVLSKLRQSLNTCAITAGAESNRVDPRWQAAVLFAPWGMEQNVFAPASLARIQVPALFVAGTDDDVSGYESGVKALFESLGSASKYLLSYENARHNIAPHPAPVAALADEFDLGHYHESAWDAQQLNRINQHFVLAMLDCHLKKDDAACGLLDLRQHANQSRNGGVLGEPWPGFPSRYATGMRWDKQ
ncbi:MAG: dienelactone hydrolase [Pseudomonadales bacterium]|nr:dienelactone hydrolase [Pseudomonadales bacterium]